MAIQREPIHLHDTNGEILCDSAAHSSGVLTLSTHMAVMTSCHRCLTALDDSAFTPITEDEFEALVRRARGTLARASEPLTDYLACREQEYADWVRLGDEYRTILFQLPAWAVIRRAKVRAVLRRHESEFA
jgi:hypothetical protein